MVDKERKPETENRSSSGARGFMGPPRASAPDAQRQMNKRDGANQQSGGSGLPVINLLKRTPQATSETSTDPLVGSVLANTYAIIDIIGQGDMATVYRARHLHVDKLVAVKTMKCRDPELLKRFAREVEAHSKLNHPNIVTPFEIIDVPGQQPYFVMEYLEGMSLAEILSCRGRIEREEEIATIIKQACDALSHAHEFGVIHRDMKPGNIVLLERNGRIVGKVVDFGLAKLQGEMQLLTRAGQALGSPLYMSPEQCMGLPLSNRSDIYSLGVVAYEMITGVPPFLGESIRDVMAAHCDANVKPIPIARYCPKLKAANQLNDVIGKALATDPDARYSTAFEFKRAVQAWMFAAGLSDSVDPTEPPGDFSNARIELVDSVEMQKESIVNLVSIKQVEKKKESEVLLQSSRALAVSSVEKKRNLKSTAMMKLLIVVVLAICLSLIVGGLIIVNLDTLSKLMPPGNSSPGATKGGIRKEEPARAEDAGASQSSPEPAKSRPKTARERRFEDPPDGKNVRRLENNQ